MNRTEVGEGRFSRDRTRTKVPKCQDGALEHSQEGNVGSSQPLEGVDTPPPPPITAGLMLSLHLLQSNALLSFWSFIVSG